MTYPDLEKKIIEEFERTFILFEERDGELANKIIRITNKRRNIFKSFLLSFLKSVREATLEEVERHMSKMQSVESHRNDTLSFLAGIIKQMKNK